jgi:hypothetical protein
MTKLCALLLLFGLPLTGWTATLLDDDWDDGDRTDTNLPEESAWFGSVAAGTATLSAAPNALTANVRVGDNLSSRLWITHFTPAGSPVDLAPGETLKLTLDFVPRGVSTSNIMSSTTRGLRFGLFNFSEPGAARVTADGFSTGTGTGAPGTNVTGYMLNMNFSQTFTINNTLQLMKRTDVTNISLMGATGAFTGLGSGGPASDSPGFSNDVPYTLEFSIRRLTTSLQIATRFSDTNGWSVSHSVTDPNGTFKFDGFAIRPNAVVDSAEAFTFTRLKVETIPFAFRIISAQVKPTGVFELAWESLPGKSYEVRWREGLEPGARGDVLATVPAQGTTASIEDTDTPFEAKRFYQVFQLP